MTARYKTLEEFVTAHKEGKSNAVLHLDLDNDATYAYENDGEGECAFSMHPEQVLEEALKLLGVPTGYV